MDKAAILHTILQAIEAEIQTCQIAAREAGKAAADPDSKAENKYDTRNLEASYIARGQSLRLQELAVAREDFQAMLGGTDITRHKVQSGALVLVETPDEDTLYYMGPAMGGLEVPVERQQIFVLTPTSPLGARLMGQKPGFHCELAPGQPASRLEILTVE